jgi:hypothetical protein
VSVSIPLSPPCVGSFPVSSTVCAVDCSLSPLRG